MRLVLRRSLFPILLFLSIGIIVASALMQYSKRIQNCAKVKVMGVGVYEDISCTIPVSEINWGMLEPGQTVNLTVYIRNEGNTAINLTIYSEDWSPANASNFIAFTCDYDGRELSANDIVIVNFVLSVSSEIHDIDEFSFSIVIAGSG